MTRRIGTCPVATERAGKPEGHNMISVIPYCKQCKPKGPASTSGPPDLCAKKHTGHRYCNGCGNQQRQTYTDDWQECQWYVAIDEGRWTRFGFCSNKAKEQHHMNARHGDGKVWRWVCGIHTPEAFSKRAAKQEAKYQAWKDGFERKIRRGRDQNEYEKLLIDIAGWMAKNPELVAGDEWLQAIADKMSENETLVEALAMNT